MLLFFRCTEKKNIENTPPSNIECVNRLAEVRINQKQIIGNHIDSVKAVFDVHYDMESSAIYDSVKVYLNLCYYIPPFRNFRINNNYSMKVADSSKKILTFKVYSLMEAKDYLFDNDIAFSKSDVQKFKKYLLKNYTNIGFNLDSLMPDNSKSFGHIKRSNKYCNQQIEYLEIIDTASVRNKIVVKYGLGDSTNLIDFQYY